MNLGVPPESGSPRARQLAPGSARKLTLSEPAATPKEPERPHAGASGTVPPELRLQVIPAGHEGRKVPMVPYPAEAPRITEQRQAILPCPSGLPTCRITSNTKWPLCAIYTNSLTCLIHNYRRQRKQPTMRHALRAGNAISFLCKGFTAHRAGGRAQCSLEALEAFPLVAGALLSFSHFLLVWR